MWVPRLRWPPAPGAGIVDRQVLSCSSLTHHLADTALSAQDYGKAFSLFFYVYAVANLVWGSLLDFLGLRFGIIAAAFLWSVASASHAFMGGFWGFAFARGLLGLLQGATSPGGLRTAVESLLFDLCARGIATSFSGGVIGAIVTPLIALRVAVRFGWRSAFILSGLMGLGWASAMGPRPLAARRFCRGRKKRRRSPAADLLERRFWALVFSYALPCIAPGPILTIIPLYLNRGMGISQAQLSSVLWMPPWLGIGYFFWGWVADRFAAENRRPVGLFSLLTVRALAFGLTYLHEFADAGDVTDFVGLDFIGGGFQMVALKVGSYAFPREQAAMMSGIASEVFALENAILSPWFLRILVHQQQYSALFWVIAAFPLIGVVAWWVPQPPRGVGANKIMFKSNQGKDYPQRSPDLFRVQAGTRKIWHTFLRGRDVE